jgi:hypothetical protein
MICNNRNPLASGESLPVGWLAGGLSVALADGAAPTHADLPASKTRPINPVAMDSFAVLD